MYSVVEFPLLRLVTPAANPVVLRQTFSILTIKMNQENKNCEKMDVDDLSRIEQSLKLTDECGHFTTQASSVYHLTFEISHSL